MAAVFTRKSKPIRFETPAIANDGVLPTEVLYEVLLRLPAKVLCRLRLVCRAWKALTCDPSFANTHSTRNPLFVGLCNPGSVEIHIMDLSGHAVNRMHIEQGIHSYELSTQFGFIFMSGGMSDSYVLNQATGAIMVLPKIVIKHITFGIENIFGYVPSTREYKILRSTLCLTDSGADEMFHVITLGSRVGQWRVRAQPPMLISTLLVQRAVIDGVAYFLSNKDRNNTCPADINIVMFDLATEEWRPSALQGPLSSAFSNAEKMVKKIEFMIYLQLVELNRCLVIVYSKWDDYLIDLWFLVDMDKGLWTKRYSVCCSPTSWDDCRLRPLTVLADGRIVLLGQYRQVLGVYDPKTSTWGDWTSVRDYYNIAMLNGSLLC